LPDISWVARNLKDIMATYPSGPANLVSSNVREWIAIVDPTSTKEVIINLKYVTKIRVGGAGNVYLIFHHAVSIGSGTTTDGATQAIKYATSADATAGYNAVKSYMMDTLNYIQQL
jgi:hypothetical protein